MFYWKRLFEKASKTKTSQKTMIDEATLSRSNFLKKIGVEGVLHLNQNYIHANSLDQLCKELGLRNSGELSKILMKEVGVLCQELK